MTFDDKSGSRFLNWPFPLFTRLRRALFRRSDLNPKVAAGAGTGVVGSDNQQEQQTKRSEYSRSELDDGGAAEAKSQVDDSGADCPSQEPYETCHPGTKRNDQVDLPPWAAIASAVVGDSHREIWPPTSCQDFCAAHADQRPFLVLADGLGSAKLSHLGADQIVRMVSCFILAQNRELSQILDIEHQNDGEADVEKFIESLYTFASYVISDLAKQTAHEPSSFRCTLLFAIVGEVSVLWAQLGDGVIIVQDTIGIKCVSPRKDASWINAVSAIGGPDDPREPAYGILSAADVTGIAVLSDGAAERLVSNDHGSVAGRLATFWSNLRLGNSDNKEIRRFLLDPDVWSGTTGDDKAIAMLAR